jgi:hypothetical protein
LKSTPLQLTSLARELASGFFPARIRLIVDADTPAWFATVSQSAFITFLFMSIAIIRASTLKFTVFISSSLQLLRYMQAIRHARSSQAVFLDRFVALSPGDSLPSGSERIVLLAIAVN